MNVEIGAEAALFPKKEYINVIAVAVRYLILVILRARSFYHFFLVDILTFCWWRELLYKSDLDS